MKCKRNTTIFIHYFTIKTTSVFFGSKTFSFILKHKRKRKQIKYANILVSQQKSDIQSMVRKQEKQQHKKQVQNAEQVSMFRFIPENGFAKILQFVFFDIGWLVLRVVKCLITLNCYQNTSDGLLKLMMKR